MIEEGNVVGQKMWANKATQHHKMSSTGLEIGDKIEELGGVLS